MRTLIHRSRLPGTFISTAEISGVSTHPMTRAAVAGKADVISGVAVNIMCIMSSSSTPFSDTIRFSKSEVIVMISSPRSQSTVTAPRMPLTAIVLAAFLPESDSDRRFIEAEYIAKRTPRAGVHFSAVPIDRRQSLGPPNDRNRQVPQRFMP